jgi:hypothetical protein
VLFTGNALLLIFPMVWLLYEFLLQLKALKGIGVRLAKLCSEGISNQNGLPICEAQKCKGP